MPLLVPRGHIARMVVPLLHHLGGARRINQIGLHHPDGPLAELDADLALITHLSVRIDENDRLTRQRAAHGPWLQRLAGTVANERTGLGLAEAVPNRESPGAADLLDYLRIKRLPSACELA